MTKYECIICYSKVSPAYSHRSAQCNSQKDTPQCQGYVCRKCLYTDGSQYLRIENCPACRAKYVEGEVFAFTKKQAINVKLDRDWHMQCIYGLTMFSALGWIASMLLSFAVFVMGCFNSKKYKSYISNDYASAWGYFASGFLGFCVLAAMVIGGFAVHGQYLTMRIGWNGDIPKISSSYKLVIAVIGWNAYVISMYVMAILDFAGVIGGIHFIIGNYGWWFWSVWTLVIVAIPVVLAIWAIAMACSMYAIVFCIGLCVELSKACTRTTTTTTRAVKISAIHPAYNSTITSATDTDCGSAINSESAINYVQKANSDIEKGKAVDV